MATKRTLAESDKQVEEVQAKKANTQEGDEASSGSVHPTELQQRFQDVYKPDDKEKSECVEDGAKQENKDEVDGDKFPKYDLKKGKPPAVYIFNNSKNREGSQKDGSDLIDLFSEKLNFVVVADRVPPVFEDLSGQDFKSYINQISGYNYTLSGALIMAIMTHSKDNGTLLFHNGSPYTSEIDLENDVIQPFCRNPTLIGKPKVFIITGCRGSDSKCGVEPMDGVDGKTVPQASDVLVAFSTAKGEVSMRDKTNGTWFIQEFVNVVKDNYKKYHLVDLLAEVQRKIAEKTSKEDGCSKNMPEHRSALRKQLYLKY